LRSFRFTSGKEEGVEGVEGVVDTELRTDLLLGLLGTGAL
jgi:hypothetical protein